MCTGGTGKGRDIPSTDSYGYLRCVLDMPLDAEHTFAEMKNSDYKEITPGREDRLAVT